ncbi:MAG: hypothetical protein RLZZ15_1633 [Verrucomicrobiota bacterium]|jgi:hypothetical protein
MDEKKLFETWAPSASPWSAWAKPAPFAHFTPPATPLMPLTRAPVNPIAITCAPAAAERVAVILVLSGAATVHAALALARVGYRPVPLFNSCPPAPEYGVPPHECAVDARAILDALAATAPELAALSLPVDAPPAFLIDAARMRHGAPVSDGEFDNRAVVFAADFPSAGFLRGQSIRGAALIHDTAVEVGEDLRHALRHWPADGISIAAMTPDGAPREITWPRGGFWGELRQRWRALVSLRRNARGGFGDFVPEASGG